MGWLPSCKLLDGGRGVREEFILVRLILGVRFISGDCGGLGWWWGGD